MKFKTIKMRRKIAKLFYMQIDSTRTTITHTSVIYIRWVLRTPQIYFDCYAIMSVTLPNTANTYQM